MGVTQFTWHYQKYCEYKIIRKRATDRVNDKANGNIEELEENDGKIKITAQIFTHNLELKNCNR